MYMAVKHFHLACVALSVLLLLFRFALLTMKSPLMSQKWLKITPHVVDTFLLLSAATLCVLLGQYPVTTPWLSEKLIAVICYILMGFAAIKGRTMRTRLVGLVGALAWLALIGKLAMTKQPFFL